ncbi:hypothetical protein ACKKBG_A19985 [Auxenochlorella protothecoides x Auxenochlorella symbiontica]
MTSCEAGAARSGRPSIRAPTSQTSQVLQVRPWSRKAQVAEEKGGASQHEGQTGQTSLRTKKTGCQQKFTIKQLRQDSKKSIVF